MSHGIKVFVGPAACLRRLCDPAWPRTLYAGPWCPDGPQESLDHSGLFSVRSNEDLVGEWVALPPDAATAETS